MNILVWTIVVVAGVGISVFGTLVVRRHTQQSGLPQHHDFVNSMLSVVATLFAILLGFLVAQALSNYEETRGKVVDEANHLGDIYRLAGALPDQDRIILRQCCREYCKEIMDTEWPLMEQRKHSESLIKTIEQMWQVILSFEPPDNRLNNIQQSLIAAAQQMGEDRRSRWTAMLTELSPVLLTVVISGCAIMVVFTYFFFVESALLHCFMTGLITLCLIGNLMLLHTYSYPFSGLLKITPTAFKVQQVWFDKPEVIIKLRSPEKAPRP
jgi:Protein of unknown function (DUF4239)